MKPYAIGGAAYHAEKTGLAHFVCASEACVALLGFRFADTAGFIMDAEQRGLIQAGGILMRAYADATAPLLTPASRIVGTQAT